jgi:uncharacterized OsmC-like protein
MNSVELRNIQSPLKEKYRLNPETAIVTLKARGNLGEGVSCMLDTGRALMEAGLHPATGGDGTLLCSGDLLLEALVACAGVTFQAVATAMGIEIKNGTVSAEGKIDFRGTLGVSQDVPVGFISIKLCFDFESDADENRLDKLLNLTERYCVVYQSLTKGVQVETLFNKK